MGHAQNGIGVGQNQIQIARHAANHGQLLPVLLAKQRQIGLDLIEQLADHGGHPIEMPWPRRTAQPVTDAGDGDVGGIARRVHHRDFGRPDQRHALSAQQIKIAFARAGIRREILVRAELARIDEDRDGNVIGAAFCLPHQGQMPFMQRPHGGHQGQLACRPQGGGGTAQWIKLLNDLPWA